MATLTDLMIFMALLWLAVLAVAYFTDKKELQALDSLLGFYLFLELVDLSLPLGLFMLAGNLWILYEALKSM